MAAICHGLRLKPQNRMPKVRKVSCKPRTAQRGSWRGGIGGRRMVVNGMRMEEGSLKRIFLERAGCFLNPKKQPALQYRYCDYLLFQLQGIGK